MKLRMVALAGTVAFGAALMIFGLSLDSRLPGNNAGYKPIQPIAYSHALHAGELKLDCGFCHTGAEASRHAGIPPVSTCMKCHDVEAAVSQVGSLRTLEALSAASPEIAKLRRAVQEGRPVAWVRIHRLPPHVDFPHHRHVRAGVACQACHGEVQGMERVEQVMALSMGECLACHRKENQKSEAGGKPAGAPTDCVACHH